MNQFYKLSVYTLFLTSLVLSQSLTGNYQVDYINVDYTWVVRPPDATTDLEPVLSDPSNPYNAQGGYDFTVSWPSSANPLFSYPIVSFAVGDTARTLPVPLWGLLQLAGFPYGWISMNVDFNDDGTFHINDASNDFFNGDGSDGIAPPPFYRHGSNYPTTVTADCVTGQEVLPVNEDGTWTSAGTFVDEFRNQLNQGWGITLSGTFAEFSAVDLLNDVPGVDYGQVGNSIDFTDFPWREEGTSAPHHTPNPSYGTMQVTYNDDFSTVQDFGVGWSATDGPSSNINVVDPTDDGYIEEEAGFYNGVLGSATAPIGTAPDGNPIFDPTSDNWGEWAQLFDPVGGDGIPMNGDEPLQFTGYYFTYNFMMAYGAGVGTFEGCAEAFVPGCVAECMAGGTDQASCVANCSFLSVEECADDAGAAILTNPLYAGGTPLDAATAGAVAAGAYAEVILPCLGTGGDAMDCVLNGLIWCIGAAEYATGGAWSFPDDSGGEIDLVGDLNFIDTDGDGIPDTPTSSAGGRLTFQADNLCIPVLETQEVTARFQNTENFRWLDQVGFGTCVVTELPTCVAECMGTGETQDNCVDYCTGVCLATNGNPGMAQINAGWNLAGLPIETSGLPYLYDVDGDQIPDLDLFGDPTAEGIETVPGSLYEFNGTYVPAVAPVAGKGYWLRSTTDHVALFQGYDRLTITHTLTEGWNMISGITEVMYLNEITDPNGVIVPGSLYDFAGTYADAQAIIPGRGYWVRASETADVTFTKGTSSGKTREFQRQTANTIQLTNGMGLKSMPLYFGLAIADEKQKLSYGLPPAPPEAVGAFDIRFENDMRYIENTGVLFVSDNSKELTITYEIVDGSQWILSGSQQYTLEGSGELIITGDVSELTMRKAGTEALPGSFALRQNFPNPFNPVTQIAIQLPENQHTTVSVWTLAGQMVETLHSGDLSAGVHTFSFNGDQLASGMYFYRVDAGPYQATKKMLLMK
mgnify:CR=1 FL=1|tara:strand:- start:28856 stop:31780 length:2925 start_codon:yes stop_codon:yes gene_type:complete